jgi:N-acetylneuraminate lyase
MKLNKIEGLISAPFTPFDAEGKINLKMIGPYADLLSRNGIAGAFVCGSSGEGQLMDVAERIAVTEEWLKVAPKGFKVIVHVGTNSLPDIKRLMAHAQAKGAHSAGLLSPSYHKPGSVKWLAEYFAEVAASAPELPVYFYNIPSMTGVNFPMIELLEALDGRVPNFAGVKYTYEDIMDYSRCLEFNGRKYDMLFGRDELLLCAWAIGAKGAVGSTFNFAAPLYLDVIKRYEAGDIEGSNAMQCKSHKMLRALFGQGIAPLAAQKAVMRLIGIDCGDTRLPLPKLSKDDHAKIAKAMESAGFSEYRCR